MRTILSQFSEEFCHSIRPLLSPLERATTNLASLQDKGLSREILAQMREVQHQFEVLVNKVEDQEAFVLIFGPLKSGKSTLMNALAAAYVSEVSSLPAYPCMVYVTHAEERAFVLTRYDGRSETFTDSATLQLHMQRAHVDLARAIREAEERGEEFDPALHFTEAIRRVDVKMPAGDLEQSSAVLVDTPGLYSRMKFGYDRMTREFRNTASSAIFVVKSDNLFLEQVFEEFGQLLDLFSRIFLVINVDSSKMDLGPMGDLIPSVEQKDPLRIVEAFENFSMSAPLKAAADDRRLRIYPIDLQRAALERLKSEEEDPSQIASEREASFAAFQGELADFLNSTDYLVAFIHDSLRRSETLMGELSSVLGQPAIVDMSRQLADLRNEEKHAEGMRVTLEKLGKFEWSQAFGELRDRLGEETREKSKELAKRAEKNMDAGLERWFKTNASLQSLNEDDLLPELTNYRDELAGFVQATLAQEAAGPAAGIRVPRGIESMLREVGLPLDEFARHAIDATGAGDNIEDPSSLLSSADIPVRKRFWDWILFRSRTSIRHKLLGPSERPSIRISVSDKGARLGGPAKEAMKRSIDRAKGGLLARWNEAVEEGYLSSYTRVLSTDVRERLATKAQEVSQRLEALKGEIAEVAERCERIDELSSACKRAGEKVAGLRGAYHTIDDKLREEEEVELLPVERQAAEEPEPKPSATPLNPEG